MRIAAGRQLDALIAKNVFQDEWTDVRQDEQGEWAGRHPGNGEKSGGSASAASYQPIPHYSTNEDAAAEILKKFKAEVTDHGDGQSPFTCRIYRDGKMIAEGTSHTRPLAICYAALMAAQKSGKE
ncbi:MAG TPA: hypothetical protein VGB17_15485 [Pyrinomonadaceae bacterium]|jgi:hypothetical protein